MADTARMAEPEDRGPAGHASDEDPLLRGERRDVISALRRSLPTFSFRGWRRARASSEASPDADPEAGLGPGSSPPAPGDGSTDAQPRGSSRDTGSSGAGPSSDASDGAGASLAERQGLGGSPTARSGLLGEFLRLGSGSQPRGSSGSLQGGGSGGGGNPICLICLEPLTPEDFESGEAIILDCQCRGDMAMRHRTCAEKWAHVKGNRVCDVCKTVVKNLPEVPPRQPDTASTQGSGGEDGEMLRHRAAIFGTGGEPVPGGADVVFDCIRVTWVAMIICILFFEMNLANALWTGLIVGLAYTLFVRAMYRHQLAAIMREQQRMAAEGAAPQPHVVHVV